MNLLVRQPKDSLQLYRITIESFWIFFIIGLASNYTWSWFSGSHSALWMTPFLTAFIAAICSIPVWISEFFGAKNIAKLITVFFGFILLFLLCIDYFLITNFSLILNQDIVDIIADSNPNETKEFLCTYLPVHAAIGYFAVIGIFIYACLRISKWASNNRYGLYISAILIITGGGIWGYCIRGYLLYGNGYSIPQFTTITRAAYSGVILKSRLKQNAILAHNCKKFINEQQRMSTNKSLTICLVIGESHSVFHTPAYGYKLNTFPHLTKIEKDSVSGTTVWYNDIVSLNDHTHNSMESIFSMGQGADFTQSILFPAVFKTLGYKTALYDNQYFRGHGITFHSSPELSDLLYDSRNRDFMTDEELIESIELSEHLNSLDIVHILGSHYEYENRYPHDRFTKFTAKDYPDVTNTTKAWKLAHYDNSLTFTDYILYKLISRLMNQDAALVYISDHGEDLYNQGDIIGHGNAASLPELAYQIRVPMMIWLSPQYIKLRPDLTSQIIKSNNRPGTTDDIGHLLLDIAGEEISAKDSTRSIINPKYINRPRIVLKTLNFDNATRTKLPF